MYNYYKKIKMIKNIDVVLTLFEFITTDLSPTLKPSSCYNFDGSDIKVVFVLKQKFVFY